jgi:hypothetical protein
MGYADAIADLKTIKENNYGFFNYKNTLVSH